MNVSLAIGGSSVRAGRRAVCDRLEERGVPEELVDRILLMTSELLTNAVLHSDGEATLLISIEDRFIRIEVADRSSVVPMLRHPPPDATSGRGMEIVDALASRWGVEEIPGGGKSVWFEVTW